MKYQLEEHFHGGEIRTREFQARSDTHAARIAHIAEDSHYAEIRWIPDVPGLPDMFVIAYGIPAGYTPQH